VASIFVDLNGFTQLCIVESPEAAFELVWEFRRRISACVAAAGGCINQHFGDGSMASFGMLESDEHEATRAMRCARAILRQISSLNAVHRSKGWSPVSVSIGMQWGRVVLANFGTGRRPDIGLIGDAVNVASRLEQLAHELDAAIVIGGELVEEVHRESGADPPELDRVECLGPQRIRGRASPVLTWALPARLSDALPIHGCASALPRRMRGGY